MMIQILKEIKSRICIYIKTLDTKISPDSYYLVTVDLYPYWMVFIFGSLLPYNAFFLTCIYMFCLGIQLCPSFPRLVFG